MEGYRILKFSYLGSPNQAGEIVLNTNSPDSIRLTVDVTTSRSRYTINERISKNAGYTLIELIISLAVLSILLSAFLGIQVFFLKCNQISSENLNASICRDLYEKAKECPFLTCLNCHHRCNLG